MEGTLVSGAGVGAEFVGATQDVLADAVGFRPYPGTVNLEGIGEVDELPLTAINDDLGDPHCDGVHLRPCTVGGIRGSVIRPLVPDYPASKLELLAPVPLREVYGLEDGASLELSPPDEPWAPAGPRARPASLGTFDAVVFDLDGTLVDLAVDWQAVHDGIEERFGSSLEKAVTDHSQNELFGTARTQGFYDDLATMIAEYERDGATNATPLAAVRDLDALAVPVGICTANAREAAERALEQFGVASAVDAIVARETIHPGKPDPGPLLECLERLETAPGNALFVGDEPTDAEAAVRAATSFLHVDQLWPRSEPGD